jgi:hypothetical protein
MSSKPENKFDKWQSDYRWEKCELGNENYGKYLSSYVRNQKTPLVLNIDGSWGAGKTHFLRQLYTDLRFTNDCFTIHINAWESDFSSDPLLVIISEFISQMRKLSSLVEAVESENEILKTVAKYSKRLWNATAIGVGAYLSEKADNAVIGEVAKQFTFNDDQAVIVGKSLKDNYLSQKQAMQDTKKSLSNYLNCCDMQNKKIFVLIDELDRCRPSYAIEVLETIKHFFELDGFVFIVATDTTQLSHSIKAVYGAGFDGKEYLSRFFNRSAKLPEPKIERFTKLCLQKSNLSQYKDSLLILGTGTSGDKLDILSKIFTEVSLAYGLSLRKIDQLVNKFESIVLYEILNGSDQIFDYRLLIQLIAEYESSKFKEIYDRRKQTKGKGNPIPDSISNGLHNTSQSVFKIVSLHSLPTDKHDIATEKKYDFSYRFAAFTCNKGDSNSRVTVKKCLDKLQENSMGRSGTERDLDNEKYITSFEGIGDKSKFIWSLEDYFTRVELSNQIS